MTDLSSMTYSSEPPNMSKIIDISKMLDINVQKDWYVHNFLFVQNDPNVNKYEIDQIAD